MTSKASQNNTLVVFRKVRLIATGEKSDVNETYKYIRDKMYAQYRVRNLIAGHLYRAYYNAGCNDESPEFNAAADQILSNTSPILDVLDVEYDAKMVEFACQKVSEDFLSAVKNRLEIGTCRFINYKRTQPLQIDTEQVTFHHNYSNAEEFGANKLSEDAEVTVELAQKYKLKAQLGLPYRSGEIRSVFYNLFAGEYKLLSTSIAIDDKAIILTMSIETPYVSRGKKSYQGDADTSVGVILLKYGQAVCAVNNNNYARCYIGDKNHREYVGNFLHRKEKYQTRIAECSEKIALYNQMEFIGKTNKIRALKREIEKYEKNIQNLDHAKQRYQSRTYDGIARSVVNFATKNHAKTIRVGLHSEASAPFYIREVIKRLKEKAADYKIELVVHECDCFEQKCSYCGEPLSLLMEDSRLLHCNNPDCFVNKVPARSKTSSGAIEKNFNAARIVAKLSNN